MAVLPEVLIVEDDSATQMLLSAVVTRLGYHPTATADGAAALSLIAARPFAVILLDVLMPKMSGLDVLRQIKVRTPGLLPRTIVLTVATEITPRDCPKLLQIAAFLRKPVDIDVLATTIYACADGASPLPDKKRAGGLESTIRR